MSLTVAQLVEAYVERWGEKEKIQARHKEELAPVNEQMDMIQSALQKVFEEQNVKNQGVPGVGTAYRAPWTSVRVKDWPAVLGWIKANERWDVLKHDVAKAPILDDMKVVDDNGEEVSDRPCPVPGIAVEKGWRVNVRRS